MKFETWSDDWWEMALATPAVSLRDNLPSSWSCPYAVVVVRMDSSLMEVALFN